MTFDKEFRGYNKSQVDAYLKEIESTYNDTMAQQRDRIFALVDENAALAERLKQYQADEKAIARALVESQKLADDLKHDADQYSQLTLRRAKVFHAAWQSYAQTILNAFSDEEMRQFNSLIKKIENLIDLYEGESASDDVAAVEAEQPAPSQHTDARQNQGARLTNPIEKVTQASDAVIDLQEILEPQESLEDICQDLGLTSDKKEK